MDTFLAYRHTQTLEAKKVLMDTIRGGKSTEEVLEEMRLQLVGGSALQTVGLLLCLLKSLRHHTSALRLLNVLFAWMQLR